ncbi:Putative Ser/Thr protein kinase KinX [Anas platyrhynchos]|uniref:Putative Ser/Thr protein kinase KinX n=1 Tax=Anas platyrhynchos TaxID=8839 RepID=R0L6F4_ANAPL|nr:Putative Ser/Thr protein kinase KinX [Anas platyrhynchos]
MASAHGNSRMQSAALKPSGSSARPQHPANQTRMTNGYYGKTAMASVHMTSRTQSAALQAAVTNTGPQRVAWTKKGMRPWPYNHPAKNQGQRHVRLPANREEPMEVDPPQDDQEPMEVDSPQGDEEPMEVDPPQDDQEPMEVDPPHGDEEPMEVDPPQDDREPMEGFGNTCNIGLGTSKSVFGHLVCIRMGRALGAASWLGLSAARTLLEGDHGVLIPSPFSPAALTASDGAQIRQANFIQPRENFSHGQAGQVPQGDFNLSLSKCYRSCTCDELARCKGWSREVNKRCGISAGRCYHTHAAATCPYRCHTLHVLYNECSLPGNPSLLPLLEGSLSS